MLKILVACHKPYNVPYNDVYTPIHVGRIQSYYKEEMSNMIGDDTGDNISNKNPYYSEMTAQYWAWKNLKNIDYIGFVHYRRNFITNYTNENIGHYIKTDRDVIVTGPVERPQGRYNTFIRFVCSEDIAILLYVVKKLYPDYLRTLSDYAQGFIDYPFNMFICKKTLFDSYAKWIFDILFECEKHIKLSPYSRAQRVFGYLSEFLMPVYFIHNKCSLKPSPYILDNTQVWGGIKLPARIKLKLLDWIYWRNKKKPLLTIDYSVKAGLLSDNIVVFDNL